MTRKKTLDFVWRYRLMLALLGLVALIICGRLLYLQIMHKDFLRRQGDMRTLRTVEMEALRGIISDRHAEPLAVSTPVDSIWAVPEALEKATDEEITSLAAALELKESHLRERLRESIKQHKEFVYLKRQLEPNKAQSVLDLKVPGVNARREYRRYYPAGEAASHLVGVVNIDGQGVEGLELAYDEYLKGKKGKKRVLKDRLGHIIQDVETVSATEPGGGLQLTIDNRLQYLAYRTLKEAVQKNKATAGSVVLMDVHTGEVLAMVNQPSYNPNNRRDYQPGSMRNRAITDVFEPGSIMKTFSLLAALESGNYQPDTKINTAPGEMKVHKNTIRDIRNMGTLSLREVLRRSSNVGTAQIVLTIPQEKLIDVYERMGFGLPSYIEFPGERSGYLNTAANLDDFSYATLAFGYSLSTTALQIARGYATIAADGMSAPPTLVRANANQPPTQVIDRKIAESMQEMLAIKPYDGGSGQAARVRGYHVAGKTGTARKLGEDGYLENAHIATFAGFAPLKQPRLVCVVVIDDPKGGQYYGGAIAAPVFSEVMAGALRLLDIPLDDETAYHSVKS